MLQQGTEFAGKDDRAGRQDGVKQRFLAEAVARQEQPPLARVPEGEREHALEALEDARLCSYTEKSQRYVTFGGEHVAPEEFGGADRERFEATVREQIAFYGQAFETLHEMQRRRHADLLGTKVGAETVEGWAKEDARYALGLATETQLGFSGNARNIEHVVRKLRHHPLAEVRELSKAVFAAASEVAPSLIILSDPERFREAFGRDVSDSFVARGRATIERLARATMATWLVAAPSSNTRPRNFARS